MKIHPVFLVVILHRYHPNDIPERQTKPPPPPVVTKDATEYEVAEILDSRIRRGRVQYLVQWQGYASEDNSWEPATTITEDVPALVQRFHEDHPNAISNTHHAYTTPAVARRDASPYKGDICQNTCRCTTETRATAHVTRDTLTPHDQACAYQGHMRHIPALKPTALHTQHNPGGVPSSEHLGHPPGE